MKIFKSNAFNPPYGSDAYLHPLGEWAVTLDSGDTFFGAYTEEDIYKALMPQEGRRFRKDV